MPGDDFHDKPWNDQPLHAAVPGNECMRPAIVKAKFEVRHLETTISHRTPKSERLDPMEAAISSYLAITYRSISCVGRLPYRVYLGHNRVYFAYVTSSNEDSRARHSSSGESLGTRLG